MAKRSISPTERPTEWTAAVAMLAVALFMFSADRDVAALTATVAACLPALITAAVEYVRKRATAKIDAES